MSLAEALGGQPYSGRVCAAKGCRRAALNRVRAFLGSRVPNTIDVCTQHLLALEAAGELEDPVTCAVQTCPNTRAPNKRLCPSCQAVANELQIKIPPYGKLGEKSLLALKQIEAVAAARAKAPPEPVGVPAPTLERLKEDIAGALAVDDVDASVPHEWETLVDDVRETARARREAEAKLAELAAQRAEADDAPKGVSTDALGLRAPEQDEAASPPVALVCVACAHQHKGDLGDAGACLSCGSGDVVLVGDAHERELLTTRLMDRVKSLRRELAEEQAAHLDQTRDYAALRNGLRDVFGHGPDAPTPDKYLIARVKYLYPFAPPVGGGVAIPQGEDHVLAFDRATGWRKVPRGSVPPLPELPEEEPPSVTPTDVQGQGDDRPTYESYDVELCGHENLGRVRARRTPMGGLELEDGSLIGPAAIFRATRIQPPPPLPEPAQGRVPYQDDSIPF